MTDIQIWSNFRERKFYLIANNTLQYSSRYTVYNTFQNIVVMLYACWLFEVSGVSEYTVASNMARKNRIFYRKYDF